jgi:hypothetical protein
MKKIVLAAPLVAALTFGIGNVFAQTTPDPHQHDQPTAEGGVLPPGTQPDPMMQMMSGMMGMMKMMHGQGGMAGMGMPGMSGMGMTDHIEGRIAFLHAELKITGEQEKLWTAFADALRKTAAKGPSGDHGAMAKAGAGIAASLKAQEAAIEARLTLLKTLIAALDPLYAALGEDQKRLADELIGPQIGMAGGMMTGRMMPASKGGMAGQVQGQ